MLSLNILHVNFSSYKGGAARAVYRLNEALNRNKLFSSKILAAEHNNNCKEFISFPRHEKIINFFKRHFCVLIQKIEKLNKKSTSPFSYNYFSSKFLVKFINDYKNFDIIHLHWVNGEILSIKDIGKISSLNLPVVWTFHDMWPFSGAEHISISHKKWINGYELESFFDLDARTWLRKKKYWRNCIQVIAPSLWMKNCVMDSKLMKNWPITVIPNTIDTGVWKPKSKYKLRNKLKINNDIKIILFSAMGGGNQYHKGKDLLIKALKNLKKKINFEIIVVGENFSQSLSKLKLKTYYLGYINNDKVLCDIYNCADVCVIPSRVENFCLTALEAQSCGIPVVSFNTCGQKDVIVDKKTGFLADSFDHQDLEKKILLILRNKKIHKFMSGNARNQVLKKFSYNKVVKKYVELYKKIKNIHENKISGYIE